MRRTTKLPDLVSIWNLCETLTNATARFKRALDALELDSASPDAIIESVREMLASREISAFHPLIDSATTLFALLDLLATHGHDVATNSIQVALPFTLTADGASLASRIHALRATLQAAIDLLPAPLTDGPSPAHAEDEVPTIPPAADDPLAAPNETADDLPPDLTPPGGN